MNTVGEPLRERLPRVDAACMRLLTVWNRRAVAHALLPLATVATRLAWHQGAQAGLGEPQLCVDFVDERQALQWQVVLSPLDLARMGALAGMARVAPSDVLADCLGGELLQALQASAALLQRPLTPRLHWADTLPTGMCRALARPVDRLGELKFGVSPEWIDALDATAAVRTVSLGPMARGLRLGWGLQLPMPPLPPADIAALRPRDCLVVGAAGFIAGRWAGRLVPMGAGVRHPRWPAGPCVRLVHALRQGRGLGELSVIQPEEMDVVMDEPLGIDDVRVPVVMALPLLSLSLCEIDELAPGRLLATGIDLARIEVELLSAGQCFARGRLVAVGDAVAVEVLDVVAAE